MAKDIDLIILDSIIIRDETMTGANTAARIGTNLVDLGEKIKELLEQNEYMQKSVYDTNDNGIVDNAELVNGLTVGSAVPENAVFTDTVYDDTAVTGRVSQNESDIAATASGLLGKEDTLGNPSVSGKVLSSTIDGTRIWVTMTSGGGGGIPEAPIDDKQYSRKNSDWDEIVLTDGPAGDTGPKGDQGDHGAEGPQGPTGLSGGILATSVEVIGIGTIGAAKDGDIFSAGKDLTEVLTQLVQKTIPPTYTTPSGSLNVNPSSTQEVGTALSYVLDPRFTQNDGGAYGEVRLYKQNILIKTQTDLTDYSHSGQTVLVGSQTYKEEIDYAQGPIKDNNFGTPHPAGRIPAGTVTKTRGVTGAYYHWYGAFGSAPPADGAAIRASGLKTFGNSFTLNTGTTDIVHVIAIPENKTLVKVIDADALNLDVTANYVYSNTLISVPDAGGNSPVYEVYISENASAFPENHRHNVTLS